MPELIPMQKINAAYERLARSDVKYRFLIDMASLRIMSNNIEGKVVVIMGASSGFRPTRQEL